MAAISGCASARTTGEGSGSRSNGTSGYSSNYAASTSGTSYDQAQDSSRNFSGNFGDDITFNMTTSNDEKTTSMAMKFMDYFSYAIVMGDANNSTRESVVATQCFEECGSGQWDNMCCASVSMFTESQNSVSYTKLCIDAMVADADVGMWMDDVYYTIECDSDNNWGSTTRSGASAVFVSSTATLALVASTLF